MVAQKAILNAAERVVGAPVRDAVLVIQRRPWVWAVVAAGFAAGLGATNALGVDYPWNFALAGALAGTAMQVGMTPLFLVRTDHTLLLTSSKRWIGRPKAVIRPIDPHTVSVQGGAVNRKVSVGGESYVMSRLFESRFLTLPVGLRQHEQLPPPPGYVPYQP